MLPEMEGSLKDFQKRNNSTSGVVFLVHILRIRNVIHPPLFLLRDSVENSFFPTDFPNPLGAS